MRKYHDQTLFFFLISIFFRLFLVPAGYALQHHSQHIAVTPKKLIVDDAGAAHSICDMLRLPTMFSSKGLNADVSQFEQQQTIH